MRRHELHKWREIGKNKGLLFFALLVDELLFGDPMRGTSDNTWDYWADAKTMLVIGDSGWNDSEIEAVYKKYYKKAQKVTF